MSQVYALTHNGEQNKTNMEKEFISFSFSDSPIEDFGFISVTPGDRLNLSGSAPFQDETSTITGRDGQQYWGTSLQAKAFSFSLATDGVEAKTIEKMKAHFSPGKSGYLILSEYPNRRIMVRISSPIEFNLIPFMKNIEYRGQQIKTNNYKGEATIQFIADFPYWESIVNNYETVFSNLSDEQKKIAYEENLLTGDNLSDLFCGDAAEIDQMEEIKLYNAGQTNSFVKLEFTIIPEISHKQNDYDYISAIYSDYYGAQPYNYIRVYNANSESFFKYTLPNLWFSINKAIALIGDFILTYSNTNNSALRFEQLLRAEVPHSMVKTWAVKGVDLIRMSAALFDSNTGLFKDGWQNYFSAHMLKMIQDDSGNYLPAHFIFNSKDGSAQMVTKVRRYNGTLVETIDLEENVGDMVRSRYLKIGGGSFVDANGVPQNILTLQSWRGDSSYALNDFSISYKYYYL